MAVTAHLIGVIHQIHLYSLLPIDRLVTTEICLLASHFEKELQVFSMMGTYLMDSQKVAQVMKQEYIANTVISLFSLNKWNYIFRLLLFSTCVDHNISVSPLITMFWLILHILVKSFCWIQYITVLIDCNYRHKATWNLKLSWKMLLGIM